MAKKIIKAQMMQRRDLALQWSIKNPVLLDGELGIIKDQPGSYKVGDGVTAWNDLPLRGFDGNIVQELGYSATSVMSQKAITEQVVGQNEKLAQLDQRLPTNAQGETLGVWVGTEEEYNALESEADNVVYLIVADRTSVVKYLIEYNLTDCTSNNAATSIEEGMPFETRLTPNEGLSLASVVVTMGGLDITSEVYANGVISILAVTGNISINAVASEVVNIQPVMDGLGIWLDATDNQDNGIYDESATTWVSKVECGSLGKIVMTKGGNCSFIDKAFSVNPVNASEFVGLRGADNPFSEAGMGEVGTGDFAIEMTVDSDWSVYNTSGDSIYLFGVNAKAVGSSVSGRWRAGLYNKTNKYLDLWVSSAFATSTYTPSAGKHTIAFVRRSGVLYFYDNGVLVAQKNSSSSLCTVDSAEFTIAMQGNTAANSFHNGFTGKIYDLKVYARGLSDEEVATNFAFNNQHYSLGL